MSPGIAAYLMGLAACALAITICLAFGAAMRLLRLRLLLLGVAYLATFVCIYLVLLAIGAVALFVLLIKLNPRDVERLWRTHREAERLKREAEEVRRKADAFQARTFQRAQAASRFKATGQ